LTGSIQDLRVALNDAGYLTRGTAAPYPALSASELKDFNFSLDKARPDAVNNTAVAADVAGALYNYLLLARGSAKGTHNPKYTRQLVFDSYVAVKGPGTHPASLTVRPN
jgi:hypothetical protein